MTEEIHLTKKDFEIQWFSGTGAGGQHRNKHQNCCRIKHIESGITCVGQNSRSREANKREAFQNLARLLIAKSQEPEDRNINTEVIRTYSENRNEVHDKESGVRVPYKSVLGGNTDDIDALIVGRAKAKSAV
jgi:peptide chain release factor 1